MGKAKGRRVKPYGSDFSSSWGGPVKPRSPMGGTTNDGRAVLVLAAGGSFVATLVWAGVEVARALT